MTSKPQEPSKERFYLLLYGLLDDKEAEDVRFLVANNSEAAVVFESARTDVEFLKELVRVNLSERQIDVSPARNVSLEPSSPSPFVFNATTDSFEEGVFSENAKTSHNEADVGESSEVPSDERFREKSRQRKKVKSKDKKNDFTNAFLKQDNSAKNTPRRNAFVGSSELLARAIYSNVCRIIAVLWKSPIFGSLIATLLFLLLAVILSDFRRDSLLTRCFFDDFRIQVALPRILARGATQTIVVKTTGVDGRPRRVPVRFCFSDPVTDKQILAHTESGNNDGNVLYEFPDLKDFPNEVKISIYAGTDESEICQTKVFVVNFEEQTHERRCVWIQPDSAHDGDVSTNLVSPVFRNLESWIIEKPNGADENMNPSASNVNSVERVFVRLYPETGRFISDFKNHINVFCSDKEGRPLAKQFLLFQKEVENPIASFSTSTSGFGSFDWIPVEETALIIRLIADGESEGEAAGLNPFISGIGQDALLGENGMLRESPATVEIDPSTGRDFARFIPNVVREPAYFSLYTQTPDYTEVLKAHLNANANVPLVATVEKHGVIVWQRFLSHPKNDETIELVLPDSLSGLLKLSLYSVAQRKFLKVAETAVFRRPDPALLPELHIDVVKPASDSERRKLVVRKEDRTPGKSVNNSTWNKESVAMEVFWAADQKSALAFLDADDVLANMSECFREETVKTKSDSQTFNPPVVFDNLDKLVKSARSKLELFQENEARSFVWTVRLVFVGCLAVAVISLFFAIFGAFSFGKFLLLCILAVGLWGYAHSLQNTLEAFFESSRDAVFAIDEEENQRTYLESNSPEKKYSNHDIKPNTRIESGLMTPRLITSEMIESGTVEFDLDNLLSPEEQTSGLMLIKLDNGAAKSGMIIPLKEDKKANVDIEG